MRFFNSADWRSYCVGGDGRFRSGHRLAKGRRGVRPKGRGRCRRRPSLRFSAHRPRRDARRRHHQTRARARRLGRVQAHGRRSDGDGRSRAAGNRDQARHDEDDRERPRHHRRPQSPAARQSGDLLHACRRSWRSGQNGDRHPRGACGKQDAADRRRRRRLRRRRSISIRRNSTRSSASKASPMAASINSPCRVATRSPKPAWR